MNNQKNDKRRQHYVPKFYLRNFSENNKSVGIYLFKENKMIKHASINDNLWKEYYYGEDAVVENKLADYEGRWNEIISSILETESLPDTEKDLACLRFFILIASARTFKRGNQINSDYNTLIKKILEIEDPELLKKIINSDVWIEMQHPALVSIKAAQEFLPLVVDLKMDLLINKSEESFVTSDNPVVFCNQLFQEKNLSRGFGWGEIGIQFIIPVSAKIAVCMYDGEVYDMKEKILTSCSTINKLNELFLNNSDEMIVFEYNEKVAKNEKINYIDKLIKKPKHILESDENGNVIKFVNKQIAGRYDLSDIFEIKHKYIEMNISSHTKEEVEEKIKEKIKEKMKSDIEKTQTMSDTEIQKFLESKNDELIEIVFDDMIRPWVKLCEHIFNLS